MSHETTSKGASLAETVSPVSALASLAIAQISPATQNGTGLRLDPDGE
jgi:hypothetical protein